MSGGRPVLAGISARVLLLVAALVLAVSGCSALSLPRVSPSTTSTGSPHRNLDQATSSRPGASQQAGGSPQPSSTPAPPPPPKGACYRLQFDQLASSANSSRPVPCREHHDAQTIFVGRLHPAAAVDSDQARNQMARVCPHRLAHLVGGRPETRHLSRFNVVWFVPTPTQAAAGAHWFRCDVIAFARTNQLFPLPRPHRLHGILDRSGALDTYGLCGSAAPGSSGFERVICGRRHSWRAIATIRISGTKYPGRHAVRTAGDSTCRDQVRAAVGYSLKFSYGWEWPTRQQWHDGQHFGYCWAPD